MSFDYNPYKHIELVQAKDGGYRVLCTSCGGERPRPSEPALTPDESIVEAFGIMAEHVRRSHERAPADFAGWSTY